MRHAHHLTRSLARALILPVALTVAVPALANADTVPVASVGASGWYAWCGQQTTTTAITHQIAQPPTGVPDQCDDYASGLATLTVRLGSHAGGTARVQEYVRNHRRNSSVRVVVTHAGGTTSSSPAVPIPWDYAGWLPLPGVEVAASDKIAVVTWNDWWSSSSSPGLVHVAAVHATIDSAAIGTPGNWATTPVPANVAVQAGNAPSGKPLAQEVPKELQGEADALPYINSRAYTPKLVHVPLGTPLQPVRVCRLGNGNCVPDWGPALDSIWRAAMGVDNATKMDRATGRPAAGAIYLGGGIPLTADVTPAPGSDQEAVVCVDEWAARNADGTTFVRPDGQRIEGLCWELWGLQADPTFDPSRPISITNTKWVIRQGVRRTGFLRRGDKVDASNPLDPLSSFWCRWNGRDCNGSPAWYGPDAATPGSPNSTFYQQGWSVSASGLPLWNNVVSDADCAAVLAGKTDWGHAFGIELTAHRYLGRWWPAYTGDGQSNRLAVGEGMRFHLPADEPMPSGLTPAEQAEFRTLQIYGAVDDDTGGGGPPVVVNPDGSYSSGGSMLQRIDRDSPNCHMLGADTMNLSKIPWRDVVLIQQGSDANPNPTR